MGYFVDIGSVFPTTSASVTGPPPPATEERSGEKAGLKDI